MTITSYLASRSGVSCSGGRLFVLLVLVLFFVVNVGGCAPINQEDSMIPDSSQSTRASADLPEMTAQEKETKLAIDMYIMELGMWLQSQGVDSRQWVNPMVGTWVVDGKDEWFVFGEQDFFWYEDHTPDGNYYQGTYTGMRGAKTGGGFVLDRGEGRDCFSLFQWYKNTHDAGEDIPTNYNGAFIVEFLGGPDNAYVINLRTGGEMTLTKTT
jgi:hypothetical protein